MPPSLFFHLLRRWENLTEYLQKHLITDGNIVPAYPLIDGYQMRRSKKTDLRALRR